MFTNENNTDAFMEDLKTRSQVRFPRIDGDRLFSFEVSPDGKLLLYRKDSDEGDLTIIATANGQTVWSDPIGYGWFDSKRLSSLVNLGNGNPYTVILNPFTGEHQEV